MDPLYVEVSDRLDRLQSDLQVHALIELVTSVRSPAVSEFLSKQIAVAAKLSRPETSLNIVKFMYLYGKKDAKFFNAIAGTIPSLVMLCYQTAADPETLRLYVESWRMNNHWKGIADKCLAAITIKVLSRDNGDSIQQLSELLKKSGDLQSLLERVHRHRDDREFLSELIGAAEKRLHAVTEALNLIHNIT